ncbi:MAG: hypothetical protein HZB39_11165 [Planctomycetes bacterium]|nr:hypothetical protein [Planctomycetota bacterium]
MNQHARGDSTPLLAGADAARVIAEVRDRSRLRAALLGVAVLAACTVEPEPARPPGRADGIAWSADRDVPPGEVLDRELAAKSPHVLREQFVSAIDAGEWIVADRLRRVLEGILVRSDRVLDVAEAERIREAIARFDRLGSNAPPPR